MIRHRQIATGYQLCRTESCTAKSPEELANVYARHSYFWGVYITNCTQYGVLYRKDGTWSICGVMNTGCEEGGNRADE